MPSCKTLMTLDSHHGGLMRWVCAALWALVFSWPCAAQTLQPVPALNARVLDTAHLLSAPQQAALEQKLRQLEQTTGTQVVILSVPTTQPEDLVSYVQRVADAWKLGRRSVGDGLLLVVSQQEHSVRIAVSKALEGAIPDLAARQIIDRQLLPAFKAHDFAGGLNAAVDALGQQIQAEALPPPPLKARDGAQDGLQWEELGVFFFLTAPIFGMVLTGLLGRALGGAATAGIMGLLGWWWTASTLLAGLAAIIAFVLVAVFGMGSGRRFSTAGSGRRTGGFSSGPIVLGGGGQHWGSSGGGSSGSSDGGGFSSGGGGDFGGGGASGQW